MVSNARAAFIIPAADVFISSFNDKGANKKSQIKIIFVDTARARHAGAKVDEP
jgi:hypothetical protein